MKRIFTLFFTLAMASMGVLAETSIPLEGEGTEASPYLIKSKEDLVNLSKLTVVSDPAIVYTNGLPTFENMYVKLTNDIDLEYDPEFRGLYIAIPPRIPTSLAIQVAFKGTFDGGGHTIHRMKINEVVWTEEPGSLPGSGKVHLVNSPSGIGLFGRLGGSAKVMNLTIASDCEIRGYESVGAVAGYLRDQASLENCRNHANVIAYGRYAGGLAGKIDPDATITVCYNSGNVTGGHSYAGGITGHALGTVSRSANTGDIVLQVMSENVSGNFGLCGGIAGSANTYSVATDNLNAGNIIAVDYAAGIAGEIQALYNCMNYGMVTTYDEASTGAIAALYTGTAFGPQTSGCVYDAQIFPGGAVAGTDFNGVTELETSVMTSGKPIDGFSTDIWQFDAGMYPVLKAFADEPKLDHARRAVATIASGENAANLISDITLASADGLTWSFPAGAKFTISGNRAVVPSQAMDTPDELTATFADYVKVIPVTYTGKTVTGPFKGSGTAEDPYLLSTKEDFITLAELTSTTKQSEAPSKENFAGTHFRITNDIDFEYTPDFQGISVAPSFMLRSYIHFDGVIDGGGHTIHRLFIDGVRWTVSPEECADSIPTTDNTACHAETDYRSFVGRLGNGGVIRNLNMGADCKIIGFSPVGGFVAEMATGSLVEDCRNYADVTGYNSQVGGIAGNMSEGTVIRRCYNAGNITTGAIHAGGITGNNLGEIELCVNTGNVTGKQICTNVPVDRGFFNAIGGIAGYAVGSKCFIKNCLNTGAVEGEREAGGLLGTFGMASNCLNYGTVKVKEANRALSGNCFGNKTSMAGKYPVYLYYDCKINSVRAFSVEDYTFNPGGDGEAIPATIGTSTTDLISGTPLPSLDTDLWQFEAGVYPVLKLFADEPKLRLAARMIAEMTGTDIADGIYNPITLHPFEGIEWSSDLGFVIEDNRALGYQMGQARLTARSTDGSLSKTIDCIVRGLSALNEINPDKEVIDTVWYDLNGLRIVRPATPDGRIYIVVMRYADGTSASFKVLNR